MLETFYGAFDAIAKKYGVFKVCLSRVFSFRSKRSFCCANADDKLKFVYRWKRLVTATLPWQESPRLGRIIP